jgi:chromosome segregation ATPase
MEKNISLAQSKEIKTKKELEQERESRFKALREFEDKIDSTTEDLKYLYKSKNLVQRNVRNAELRIASLRDNIEELQTQKILLTRNRNEVANDMKYYEEQLSQIDSDFKKFMEDLNFSTFQINKFRHENERSRGN